MGCRAGQVQVVVGRADLAVSLIDTGEAAVDVGTGQTGTGVQVKAVVAVCTDPCSEAICAAVIAGQTVP